MSTEKIDLQKLFEGLDKGVLNEETQVKVTQLIEETVEARVSAKEQLLKEEVESIKKALEEEKLKVLKESEENEKVLIEQAEKYKKELEETILEETAKYKEIIDSQKQDEISKFQKEAEELLLAEAKEFKEKQDAVLVEEVKNFKADLVEKVSNYLETKVSELVPAEIMEAATKMAVLEPLVGSIMESFSKNYVKLDTTSYKLLKEAKEKISVLETAVEEKAKAEVKLKKEKRDVEKLMKLNSLTEGLTKAQKEKAVKLLEGVELEELDSRFVKIRDIIIESTTTKPVVTQQKPQPVKKIEESVKKTEESVKTSTATESEKAIIDHQIKKVLTESEQKIIVNGKVDEKEIVPEGADRNINSWAAKVKPSYIQTTKNK